MQQPELDISSFEIFAAGLDHPECVAFDRDGFMWAGGEAGQIYRADHSGKIETICNVGGFCAGIAFSPQDNLYVCVPGKGIVRVEQSGRFEVFATHAGDHELVCPNFGVFTASGDLYVTDSGKWKQGNGYIARFSASGDGRILSGPFGYANGLALSEDERTLYMVESDSNSVLEFAANPQGQLQKRATHSISPGRFPDGLALDAESNLYITCYASDEIYRLDPGGALSLVAYDPWGIRLGAPTNLAFGANDPDWIYVANLGRTAVTRARIGRKGQTLVNRRNAK
jgi:gluconolactonase